MAEDDAPSDKPYDPTPHRLDEARKRGEIVRSADLNTAITYLGFLIAGAMVAPWATDGLGRLTQVLLGQAHAIAPLVLAPGGIALAAGLIGRPVLITGAAVAVPAVLLLVVLVAQRGLVFSPSKLAPKISRISPLDNAKQKFGAQGLFQFAKSAVKLVLVSILLALYLIARAERILAALYAEPGQILLALGRLTFEFMAVVAMLALAIASSRSACSTPAPPLPTGPCLAMFVRLRVTPPRALVGAPGGCGPDICRRSCSSSRTSRRPLTCSPPLTMAPSRTASRSWTNTGSGTLRWTRNASLLPATASEALWRPTVAAWTPAAPVRASSRR